MRAPVLLALASFALGCGSSDHDSAPVAPVPGPTVVVPHRVAFDPAKENAVWCAAFEMAWQAFGRDLLKEPLRLGSPGARRLRRGDERPPHPSRRGGRGFLHRRRGAVSGERGKAERARLERLLRTL